QVLSDRMPAGNSLARESLGVAMDWVNWGQIPDLAIYPLGPKFNGVGFDICQRGYAQGDRRA
ncbi:MAG: hypothetical protein WB696_01765, partial [Chthoniobacterales bacterium]